jgi:hypothetical protein
MGSGAARGKIGCEQGPNWIERTPQGANDMKASRTGQKKPSRPSPCGKRSPVVRIREATGGGNIMSIRNLRGFSTAPDTSGDCSTSGTLQRSEDNPVNHLLTVEIPVWRTVENCGKLGKIWSGKRDSNPRPSAWKADALATELFPLTLSGSFARAIRASVSILIRSGPDSHGCGGGRIRTFEG